MNQTPPRRIADFPAFHRTVWRQGDFWARAFNASYLFTYGFWVLSLAWLLWIVFMDMPTFEIVLAWGLAAIAYQPYHEALTFAMLNTNLFRARIAQRGLPAWREGLFELFRYIDDHGNRGRIPGAVGWGIAAWALYYGMMGFAIVFTTLLLPTFGPVTPFAFAAIDIPVLIGFFVGFRIKIQRLSEDANHLGYRVLLRSPPRN